MEFLSGHVLTLANSIIGVSILAMPYCFKQCGIILSILILLISSIISRLACHFLLKSALLARRKNFEFLAFHIFGSLGKLIIELGIIGFLLGNCIAFFVVMGDLGPDIIAEISGTHSGNALRNGVLITMAVFFVLPLGLLRNVESLMSVSKATVAFYFCLVLKIVLQALPDILEGDWITEVEFWRPAGILQCLPIFSMALFCQTQIFEIYETLPNASLEKMNSLIRVAVNICTSVYILVGTFGYILFCKSPFTGNILSSFVPSLMTDVIKIGFVLSIAFSFPIVIFPCRASLYSLLYKEGYTFLHDNTPSNYIPEGKFKLLTVVIIAVSLIIGILIPNIELVLGLVGSTIGVMICVLFPVTCFICISPKNTNERILAQLMLFVGIIVMVLGTYTNLYVFEEVHIEMSVEKIPQVHEQIPKSEIQDIVIEMAPTTIKIEKDPDKVSLDVKNVELVVEAKKPKEVRHEPPQPEEPAEIKPVIEKLENPTIPSNSEPLNSKHLEEKQADLKNIVVPKVSDLVESEKNQDAVKVQSDLGSIVNPIVNEKSQRKDKLVKMTKKTEEVDKEAIEKEDAELKEQEKVDPNRVLIETIQKKQKEIQDELVQHQKKLDEVMQREGKKNDVDQVNEAKLKAVKSIESIAKRAIEKISQQGQEELNNESNKTKLTHPEISNNTHKLETKMVPLPMIRAQSTNVSGEKPEKIKIKKNTQEVQQKENIPEVKKDETRRKKREVDTKENAVQSNENAKEICKENNKQTEKPMKNMLCELSEPLY